MTAHTLSSNDVRYGQKLLKALSARLSAEFGQGFSVSTLQLMRKFFIEYKPRIQQQAAVKLIAAKIQQPVAVEFSPVVIAKRKLLEWGDEQV